MREINLTHGKVTIVSDEWFDELNKFKWHCVYEGKTWYVIRNTRKYEYINGKQTTIRMHRQIMGNPIGMEIDHIDGDGLNNSIDNLRIVTRHDNMKNRSKYVCNTSGYPGVNWNSRFKKWRSYITVNYRIVYLYFGNSKEDAIKARKSAEELYYGEFRRDLRELP